VVAGLAIQHKVSDANKMRIDYEGRYPVIEIEFRFIRYRLVIDDVQWATELAGLLQQTLKPSPAVKGERPRLPKLYKDKKDDGVM
jgi:hypothetical protein